MEGLRSKAIASNATMDLARNKPEIVLLGCCLIDANFKLIRLLHFGLGKFRQFAPMASSPMSSVWLSLFFCLSVC
jgi:hypothetical protein